MQENCFGLDDRHMMQLRFAAEHSPNTVAVELGYNRGVHAVTVAGILYWAQREFEPTATQSGIREKLLDALSVIDAICHRSAEAFAEYKLTHGVAIAGERAHDAAYVVATESSGAAEPASIVSVA